MTLSTLIFLALGLGVGVGAALHDWFPSAVMPLDHFQQFQIQTVSDMIQNYGKPLSIDATSLPVFK